MKLWCFRDSNTYGCDSCGCFGGRYAAPWPKLPAEKTGMEVINDGKNGRMIPERETEFLRFRKGYGAILRGRAQRGGHASFQGSAEADMHRDA